jgi:lipopolysaccharide export LptBFGC system permease protein LptF
MYVREFDPIARTMSGVRMLTETTLALENSMVSADSGVWDEARKDWRLEGGMLTTRSGGRPIEWLERPDLTPQILLQRSRDTIDPETLSYTDLIELVESRPNRPDFRLALHRHITYPIACVLLLLLALPLAVYYERGSRLRRLLGAIALCGGFTLLDLVCQSLGQQGLHPIVAAWSPVIVFGSLGIVMWTGTKT